MMHPLRPGPLPATRCPRAAGSPTKDQGGTSLTSLDLETHAEHDRRRESLACPSLSATTTLQSIPPWHGGMARGRSLRPLPLSLAASASLIAYWSVGSAGMMQSCVAEPIPCGSEH